MADYTTNWHGPASVSNDVSDLKGEYISANPKRLAWKRSSDDVSSSDVLTSAIHGIDDEEAHFAVTSHVNSPSGKPDRTYFLRFLNFKFNIPSAATIIGVQVQWRGVSVGTAATGGTPPTSGDEMCDDRVYLVIDGSYYLSDNAGLSPDTDNWSLDTDGDSDIEELSEEVRGSSSSLFGFPQKQITPAKINSPQFGFVFSAKNRYENEESGTHTYPALENARVKVWYDLAEDTTTLNSSILSFWTGTLDSIIASYPLWYGADVQINDATADTADSSLSYKQLSSTDLTPNMHFGDRGEFDESATGRTPPTTAPETEDATYTLLESTSPGSFLTVSGSDINVDDTLTYSITAGNGAGKFWINSATGVLSTFGSHDFETTSQYVLTIKVADDGGLYDSATITVNIADVNEAPVAVNNAFTQVENNGVQTLGTIAASDVDSSDTLTYSITSGNTGDAFFINSGTGSLSTTGSLDFETAAQYVLVITVSDSALTDTATVTIDVTDTNEAPVAVNNAFTEDENNGVQVLGTISASDVDTSDTLTYSIFGGNGEGDFSIHTSDGVLSTTGSLDFETTPQYVLTIKVEDDSGLSDTATVTVDVTDLNEAPVAIDATLSIAENSTSLIGTVSASDVDDGDVLTYSITAGDPSDQFSIGASNGQLVAAGSGLDFEDDTQHVLTITVSDSALTDTATITVNVTNVNEPPVVANQTFTPNENETIVGTVSATDPEGDTLTYSITADDSGGTFSIHASTGQITTTGMDYEDDSEHILTVKVEDNSGLFDTATITVDVTNVNDPPYVTSETFAINENSIATVGTVAATDDDGHTLTYAITAGNSGGEFSIGSSSGTIATVSGLDHETEDQYVLTVTVTDSVGASTAGTITINVTDVNEAPVAVDAAFTEAENEGVSVLGTISASDVDDGDQLTYSITAGNGSGLFTINASTGELSTTGDLDFEDDPQHVLTINVSDSALSDDATVTVDVTNVNEAPVITGQTFNTDEDADTVGTISATDPEGDTLTYSITGVDSGASSFSMNSSTGQITIIGPGLDYENDTQHILTVRATESSGLWTAATVTVNVIDVNDPPDVTAFQTFSIDENTVGTVGTVEATDEDGDTLTYAITAGNGGGEFAIGSSTGTITTVSGLDYEDDDQHVITVTVTDGEGGSTPSDVTINVNDVNEAPVAVDNTFQEEDGNGVQVLGTVAATDPDGDTLTWSITAGNGSSLFSINSSNGSLSTTGDLDYDTASQHVLTITVTDDGTGALSDTATVTVDVTEARTYTGVPTKQYVFGSEQTTGSQCLTMSNADWEYPLVPDMSEFGMLARITLEEEVTSGERHLWQDYRAFTNTAWYFGRVHSNGRLLCRTDAASGVYAENGVVYSATDFGAYLANGNETLIYWYLIDGVMKLFAGQDDDALTLLATDTNVTEPDQGSGEIAFGAAAPSAWGWYGTIHQPMMFTANYGVDIPDETEVGTADTPVDLSGHGALFSSPNADNAFPNIDLWHPQAWTDNNSIAVETR